MLSSSVIRRSVISLRRTSLPSYLTHSLVGTDALQCLLEENVKNSCNVNMQSPTRQSVRFITDSSSGNDSPDDKKKGVEDIKSEGGKEESAEEKSSEDKEELSKEEKLENEVKELKDQLLRALAEADNTRRIAKRDVASARNFAVTSFAKSLLETSDNLTRAMEAVPEEYRLDTENHPVLATLYEGIQMTDSNLTKAFAKNGLIKFGEVGETFDPNKHEALFEYPDPNLTPGSIGQVMKVGFTLNERVIRSAEVGVVKKT